MGDTPLASLSLTHVHYVRYIIISLFYLPLTSFQNPEDQLSFASAWLALIPQALCVSYATLIWSTREVEVILMCVGQIGCEALNFVLKRLIKEERPKGKLSMSMVSCVPSQTNTCNSQKCSARDMECHLHTPNS